MSPIVWIALVVLAVVVTAIRAGIAQKNANEVSRAESARTDDNARKLSELAAREGLRPGITYASSKAMLAVDRDKNTFLYSVDGIANVVPAEKIEDVGVIDHTAGYRHSMEMASYYKGVRRDSMYKPFGSHSTKEVHEGYRQFEAYRDQTVYGLKVRILGRGTVEIPCFCGDGTLFWREQDRYAGFLRLVDELKKMTAAGR